MSLQMIHNSNKLTKEILFKYIYVNFFFTSRIRNARACNDYNVNQ
jgi:hypothetical protein